LYAKQAAALDQIWTAELWRKVLPTYNRNIREKRKLLATTLLTLHTIRTIGIVVNTTGMESNSEFKVLLLL
jgi:hypothetical protein